MYNDCRMSPKAATSPFPIWFLAFFLFRTLGVLNVLRQVAEYRNFLLQVLWNKDGIQKSLPSDLPMGEEGESWESRAGVLLWLSRLSLSGQKKGLCRRVWALFTSSRSDPAGSRWCWVSSRRWLSGARCRTLAGGHSSRCRSSPAPHR